MTTVLLDGSLESVEYDVFGLALFLQKSERRRPI